MDRAGHLRHCTFVLMREDNRFPAFHVARHLRLHFRVGPHAVFGQHADMLAQPVRLDGDVALQRLGDLVHVQRGRFVVGQQLAREGEAEGLPAADPHRRQAEGLVGHPEAVPGLVVLQRRNPKSPCLTSGPTFVTLRQWKRTLSASDSGPTPRRAKSDFLSVGGNAATFLSP